MKFFVIVIFLIPGMACTLPPVNTAHQPWYDIIPVDPESCDALPLGDPLPLLHPRRSLLTCGDCGEGDDASEASSTHIYILDPTPQHKIRYDLTYAG